MEPKDIADGDQIMADANTAMMDWVIPMMGSFCKECENCGFSRPESVELTKIFMVRLMGTK